MLNQINHANASVTPFDGTFQDVMALLEEAREYARGRVYDEPANTDGGADTPSQVTSRIKVTATREALRVTSRLTQCLAWLLLQRDIQEGELASEAALEPENRLSGESICAERGGEDDEELPDALRTLLRDSRKLYQRLERLDIDVAAAVGSDS